MSSELISSIASLLTVLVIGATAVAALVQLRHMRAGNQINAILTIGEKFQDDRVVDARALVTAGLEESMADSRFRSYVVARALGKPMDGISAEQLTMMRSVNLAGNMFEEVGMLVKNSVVDETLILDEYVTQIIGTWERLAPYIALTRDVTNDIGLWDNFEYLTVRARQFLVDHPTTYPKGVPRIPLTNPWRGENP